jgi:ketosteroid isomerase-like protein
MTTSSENSRRAHEKDRAFLAQIARDFAEGFNAGDVDRLMQYYGEEYVNVNLRTPVQSHAERRAYYLSIMRGAKLRLEVQPDDIQIRGEMALVRGTIILERPSNEGVNRSELRYLEIAERTADDRWRVIWGMDGPIQEYSPKA